MRHIDNAFLGSTEMPSAVPKDELFVDPLLGAAAISGASSIVTGLMGMGQKQLGQESRSRSGTVFNRNFLDEVGRYIGQPLSLGELFTMGGQMAAASPTLRQSMGLAPGGAAGYKRMSVNPIGVVAPPRSFGRPGTGLGGGPTDRGGYLRDTGLESLGLRPVRAGQVGTAEGRDTVPTTGGQDLGRLGWLLERVRDSYVREAEDAAKAPDDDASKGIPKGSTRRYSMADLAQVWEYNDLDKLPDVERLFRKAKMAGMDVDMNDFTLSQFQEKINKIGTIDPEMSARSKGNFSAALAYINATARSEEGFGHGRGKFGPLRF